MIVLKRKQDCGIHRVNIPGHGWQSIKPGDMLPGEHENIDFLGSQKDNYIYIQGKPEPEPEQPVEPDNDFAMIPQEVSKGKYNIINSKTGKAINDGPMTRKQAKQFISLKDDECPLQDGEFGKDFDEFEECGFCLNKELCKPK